MFIISAVKNESPVHITIVKTPINGLKNANNVVNIPPVNKIHQFRTDSLIFTFLLLLIKIRAYIHLFGKKVPGFSFLFLEKNSLNYNK